jgi:ferredoxin, 2Fe-2S
MPKIVIQNLFNKELEVKDSSKPLLLNLHHHHLDWMHACGGKGRCTTCKVIVIEGLENLDPLTEAEQRYHQQGDLLSNERLACQAILHGDIRIAVPDECKMPHMKYSY